MINQYAANGYEDERGYQAALNDELVPSVKFSIQRTDNGKIVLVDLTQKLALKMCEQMNRFAYTDAYNRPLKYKVIENDKSRGSGQS